MTPNEQAQKAFDGLSDFLVDLLTSKPTVIGADWSRAWYDEATRRVESEEITDYRIESELGTVDGFKINPGPKSFREMAQAQQAAWWAHYTKAHRAQFQAVCALAAMGEYQLASELRTQPIQMAWPKNEITKPTPSILQRSIAAAYPSTETH